MTDFCQTCRHADEEHDALLLFCEVPHCRCLRFVSENEADEDPDEPQPLNFDGDAA